MNIESTFPEIVHTNVIRPQLILLVGFVLNNEFDQNLSSSVELAPIVGYAHFGGLRSGCLGSISSDCGNRIWGSLLHKSGLHFCTIRESKVEGETPSEPHSFSIISAVGDFSSRSI
jgi:hypothetical protein